MVQKVGREGKGLCWLCNRNLFTILFVKQNGKISERLDIQFKSYFVVCACDLR